MVLCCIGLDPIVPEGGYFVMADISSIGKKFDGGEESYDFQFTKWMMREKVSSIFLPFHVNRDIIPSFTPTGNSVNPSQCILWS